MVVLKQKFCVLKTDATNAIYMCCAMQESLWVHLNFVEQKTLGVVHKLCLQDEVGRWLSKCQQMLTEVGRWSALCKR